MNRRLFLKKGMAAGWLLAGGTVWGLGCSRDLRRRLQLPALPAASGSGVSSDEWQILYYASLAPSGHNSQPWFVRVEGQGQWVVGADPARRLPAVDPENREVLLSIGGFLENLVLAAGHFGYEAELEIVGKDRFDTDLVRVGLAPGRARNTPLSPLALRRTLKTGLLSREIRGKDVKAFQETAGGGLYYFPRDTSHARCMVEAAVENFRRQFQDEAAMAEAAQWTRLSDRDASKYRDGLTTDGMEIHGLTGWMVRLFVEPKDVTGAAWREKAIEKVAVQASQGGGWMVITSPGKGIEDLIDAGRRFQRMALAARGKNIGIHPMTQTLEEGHGQGSIREAHAPSMIPQFMLRVGYVNSYPDPVSLRRPVGWFLV